MSAAYDLFDATLAEIREAGLFKEERVILSDQDARIRVAGPGAASGDGSGGGMGDGSPVDVLNFCANNYLGLANHPAVVAAAKDALDSHGFGMASVRFICGTQDLHKALERRLADFHGKEDCILYPSCFDANGGLFETLLGESDAVISDALNHASIIDGVRLSKAQRHRYAHGDLDELEAALVATQSARLRLITTDGVFSMDGAVARLDRICDLADRYDALVHVDECHATGFFGPTGRGAAEHCGVLDRVDLITSTLGKALGGASGGFTVGRRAAVELLRQRSRPYLFSNAVAPSIVAASLAVLDLLDGAADARTRVATNAARFRAGMAAAGFDLKPGEHPIVPVMLYDAVVAQSMARDLLDEGIYVIGFSFPVVPRGEARIRVQISAAHTHAQIDHAIDAFARVGRRHGVIPA